MDAKSLTDWLESIGNWNWLEIGWRTVMLIATWVIVWILVRYFSRVLRRVDEESDRMTPRDVRTLDKLLDYLFIAVGIIVTLAILGLTDLLYSALTAAGVVGIMIGFAVKDVASNFISGIFILIDQPFTVSDAIKVGDYSGTITDVALRTTTIITFDGTIVTIPNSNIATTPVVNYSIEKERRINMMVSVSSASDINLAMDTIREIIEADERISNKRTPIIYVANLQGGAIDIQVFCYVDVSNLLAAQSDLRTQIVGQFRDKNISLAVPIRVNLTPEQINSTDR